jgi:hypothetical protein
MPSEIKATAAHVGNNLRYIANYRQSTLKWAIGTNFIVICKNAIIDANYIIIGLSWLESERPEDMK